jgi:hypothetical protein
MFSLIDGIREKMKMVYFNVTIKNIFLLFLYKYPQWYFSGTV